MGIPERVEAYRSSQPEPKQTDLRHRHTLMLAESRKCKVWFNDDTNDAGKVVANHSTGYSGHTITYARWSSRHPHSVRQWRKSGNGPLTHG